MNRPEGTAHLSRRMSTGVDGLDTVLNGGLFERSVYIVMGRPGAGKTILANQLCYKHVTAGGRALYVTLLAEMHAAMLGQLGKLSFFDPAVVGDALVYLNGLAVLEEGGLDALLKMLRQGIREQRASLLVIDGMVTAAVFASSDVAYKRFIQELQSWASLMGVTVVLLTSSTTGTEADAEHTMVDGLIELRSTMHQRRCLRDLRVPKFRGSAFLEGRHSYAITDAGLQVFPKLEALLGVRRHGRYSERAVETGVPGLDRLLGGGFTEGSTTLVVGSSGAGKTVICLQFLHAGAQAGEPVLYAGLFENPAALLGKARRLGLDFEKPGGGETPLHIEWWPAAEILLDAFGLRLLEVVRSRNIRRLVIDGLAGIHGRVPYPERIASFFAVLAQELQDLGVTTLLTEETRELYVHQVAVPTGGISALSQNIVFLRNVEIDAELHWLISVMKTRDTAHARGLYQFEITDRGVVIGKKYSPMHNLLSGIPAEAQPPSPPPRKVAAPKKKKKKARK